VGKRVLDVKVLGIVKDSHDFRRAVGGSSLIVGIDVAIWRDWDGVERNWGLGHGSDFSHRDSFWCCDEDDFKSLRREIGSSGTSRGESERRSCGDGKSEDEQGK